MTGLPWWVAAPNPWGPRRTAGELGEFAGPDPPLFELAGGDDCITRGCRSPGAPSSACQACRRILADRPVNCELGQVLVTQADGSVWMCETPCILGYDKPFYRCFDVSGNVVNTFSNAPLEPRPEEFTEAEEAFFGQNPLGGPGGPPGPGSGPGGFLPGAGVGGLDLGELDFGDLGRLVQGIAGGQLDLSGVVRSIVALVLGQDRIRGALDQLAPGFTARLAPHLEQLGLTQLAGFRELNAALVPTFQQTGAETAGAVDGLGRRLLAGLVEVIGDILRALVNAAREIFGPMLSTVQEKVGDLVAGITGVFRDQLEGQRGRLPRDVDAVAGQAIAKALLAGTTAQLAALGVELLHPLKRMGIQQIVGFLADFAGFGRITGPWFDPTVRWSIGRASEHRAAQMFRTELPSPGEAAAQAYQRHIPLSDYANILAQHGFPSWWIRILVDDVFVDPRPRELTELLNGGEASPEWIAAKLKEVGWDDGDVERGTRALLLKASAPGRQRLISEAVGAYSAGQLEERELDGTLRAAGLNATHRDAWLRAARLDRRGQLMNRLAARVVDGYVNDLMLRQQAERQLDAIGFTREEVDVRLVEADLRRGVVQVRDDRQTREADSRQIAGAAFDNLKRQARAGFVDRGDFVALTEALGFTAAYAANVWDVLTLQGPASSSEDLPAIGLGAVREAARALVALSEEQVRRGRMAAEAAQSLLVSFGLDRELARELLGIARVLGIPVPAPVGIPFPFEDAGRSTFEGILADVIQQIRRGQGGVGLFEQLLERLGFPAEHRRSSAEILHVLEDLFFAGSRS